MGITIGKIGSKVAGAASYISGAALAGFSGLHAIKDASLIYNTAREYAQRGNAGAADLLNTIPYSGALEGMGVATGLLLVYLGARALRE